MAKRQDETGRSGNSDPLDLNNAGNDGRYASPSWLLFFALLVALGVPILIDVWLKP